MLKAHIYFDMGPGGPKLGASKAQMDGSAAYTIRRANRAQILELPMDFMINVKSGPLLGF